MSEQSTKTASNSNRIVEAVLPGDRHGETAHASLKGHRKGLARLWPFLGPAFIAAVAYVDPGNFATNIAGGALRVYAPVGDPDGEPHGDAHPVYVGQAWDRHGQEPPGCAASASAARDARAVGAGGGDRHGHRPGGVHRGALALNLLSASPVPGGLMTAVGAFGILELQRRGFRPLEAAIAALVGVIVVAFAFQMFYAQPEADRILAGLFTPGFAGTDSVLLAAGILGATVMPHVIYLHSALTQRRVVGRTEEKRKDLPL